MPRKSHFGIANPSELPTAQTAMQYGIGAAEKKGLLPGAGLQRRAVQMRGGGGGNYRTLARVWISDVSKLCSRSEIDLRLVEKTFSLSLEYSLWKCVQVSY